MGRLKGQQPKLLIGGTSPNTYYYIRWHEWLPDGSRKFHQRTLGYTNSLTKRDANMKRLSILLEINQTPPPPTRADTLFGNVLDEFIERYFREVRIPTQRIYRQQIENHIRPALGETPISKITTADLTRFFHCLEDNGVARSTRETIRSILSCILNRAREWGYLQYNPVSGCKIGGGFDRIREKRIPSREDVSRILEACDDRLRLLIETIMWTGVRISEALGLKWKNVDLENGVLNIVQRYSRGDWAPPKNNKPRILPLGDLLPRYQSIAGSPEELVFSNDDGSPIRDDILTINVLTPLLVRLGLKFPGFAWHTFRRAHLTWLQEEGASLWDVMDQAGHSRTQTTARYIVPNIARRAAMVKSMQASRRPAKE